MAAGELAFLRGLVFDRSAIVLSDDKQYLIESRLLPVAKELGFESVSDVIGKARGNRLLEDRLVEAMTTNETLWFRDVRPFDALRQSVVPEIMARKGRDARLAVLSAGCSSGQELYSVAMLLEEDFPQLHGWQVDLVGWDLSSAMIERARAGHYSALEMNRGLPASLLVRYFSQDGTGYQIDDALRHRAVFRRENLAGHWPVHCKFDVILLRNVLIYFDMATRRRTLREAARCLASGGYLFLGSSETMVGVSDSFSVDRASGTTFFRLKGL